QDWFAILWCPYFLSRLCSTERKYAFLGICFALRTASAGVQCVDDCHARRPIATEQFASIRQLVHTLNTILTFQDAGCGGPAKFGLHAGRLGLRRYSQPGIERRLVETGACVRGRPRRAERRC